MKKIIVALTLMISSNAWAENFGINYDISHIRYEEPSVYSGGKSIEVEEEGIMNGVSGFYQLGKRLKLRGEGRYAFGTVDYSGTGTLEGIEDYTYELRALLGYEFYPNSKMVLIPYFGYGFRYLNDDISGLRTSTGHYGYLRESEYNYVPIGARLKVKLNDKFDLELNPELSILLEGTQKSHINEIEDIPGLPLLENKQDRGFGSKVKVNLIRHINKVDLTFGVFWYHWGIQDSDVNYGLKEPKNYSDEIGGQVGVRF